MRIATPSRQTVSQPVQRMSRFATTNESGASTDPAGARHGRSVCGSRRRKTPNASGAPAYMSTLAAVIRPTSDVQLGNGRKQTQPTTNAVSSPNHGTPRRSGASYTVGKEPLRLRPDETRELDVV